MRRNAFNANLALEVAARPKAGVYGSSTQVPQVTVNQAGDVTNIDLLPITPPSDLTGATIAFSGDVTGPAVAITTDGAVAQLTFAVPPLTVTFGTGAPVAPGVSDGDQYFDDTLPTYSGYVWRGAAWNQFS